MDDAQIFPHYRTTRSDAAFAALVAAQIDLAYSVALRYVRDPHLADDVTQAVFIILAEKAAMLPSSTNISGWIFRTTQYVARNALRKLARRRRHEEKFALSRPEALPGPSADAENLAIVDKALARLAKPDQEAIVMKYYRGQSWQEIGTALGLNEEAARKRVSRSLARLRTLLPAGMGAMVLTVYLPPHAVSAAPPHLAHSILQNFSVNSGIAAGHGSAFTLAKGTLMSMTYAKLKTAAIAAAILLVALPTGLVVVRHLAAPIAQAQTGAPQVSRAKSATDPAALYALAQGQVLKRVVEGPEDQRLEFSKHLTTMTGSLRKPAGNPPPTPSPRPTRLPPEPFIVFLQKNGAWTNWTQSPANSFMLSGLMESLLNVHPQDMEGDDFLFPGDFLVDDDATPEQRRAALEKIIQTELHESIVLTFRDVPRKVFVLKGRWKYTPVKNSPRPKTEDESRFPLIDLYENTLQDQANGLSIGHPADFPANLGKALNTHVIVEAQGFPETVLWAFNDAHDRIFANPTPVLNHITEQTGLTWSEETRTVRRLFVEDKK